MIESTICHTKTVIKAHNQWPALQLDQVWSARELIWMFAWRDINIRYRQTALGIAWALIQPLTMMIIFTILCGKVGKFPSENLPYSVFCLSGLLLWQYFATAVTYCSHSLVNNPQLLTKIYFPRLVIPIANLIPPGIDLAVSSVMLAGLMLWHRVALAPAVVWVPLYLLLTLVVTLGASLWLSALNVKYRDFKYVTPFLITVWMYLTPVAYPASMIPAHLKLLYALNPMSWAVEGLRASLFGGGHVDSGFVAVSSTVAVLILISGAFYFRRMERSFAERI